MSHLEVYEKYTETLVRTLPMDDVTFTTRLFSCGLLPSGVYDKMKSLGNETEKAEYFLNKIIKAAFDIDDTDDFNKLLTVMEECDYNRLRNLAGKMKSNLSKEMNYLYLHIYVRIYMHTLAM